MVQFFTADLMPKRAQVHRLVQNHLVENQVSPVSVREAEHFLLGVERGFQSVLILSGGSLHRPAPVG